MGGAARGPRAARRARRSPQEAPVDVPRVAVSEVAPVGPHGDALGAVRPQALLGRPLLEPAPCVRARPAPGVRPLGLVDNAHLIVQLDQQQMLYRRFPGSFLGLVLVVLGCDGHDPEAALPGLRAAQVLHQALPPAPLHPQAVQHRVAHVLHVLEAHDLFDTNRSLAQILLVGQESLLFVTGLVLVAVPTVRHPLLGGRGEVLRQPQRPQLLQPLRPVGVERRSKRGHDAALQEGLHALGVPQEALAARLQPPQLHAHGVPRGGGQHLLRRAGVAADHRREARVRGMLTQ
mmetsp:Transcript_99589/g.278241  ORF Transcript_99589/g.278241 Transcript_99589/m.278241 type:complete len:290 (+) Transcript_99589:3020-3889(+)